MKKMEKRGDTNLVHKLKTKYEYLNYRINEIELDIAVQGLQTVKNVL